VQKREEIMQFLRLCVIILLLAVASDAAGDPPRENTKLPEWIEPMRKIHARVPPAQLSQWSRPNQAASNGHNNHVLRQRRHAWHNLLQGAV
jgi:hypothetical protein